MPALTPQFTTAQLMPAHYTLTVLGYLTLFAVLFNHFKIALKKPHNYIILVGILMGFAARTWDLLFRLNLSPLISLLSFALGGLTYYLNYASYVYMIWLEYNAIGHITERERRILRISSRITIASLLPTVGFTVMLVVSGANSLYMWLLGFPVMFAGPVFDMTMLYFLYNKTYKSKNWPLPRMNLALFAFSMLIRVYLLVSIATPFVELYASLEILSVHTAMLTVMLTFLDIRNQFKHKGGLTTAGSDNKNSSKTRSAHRSFSISPLRRLSLSSRNDTTTSKIGDEGSVPSKIITEKPVAPDVVKTAEI